MLIFTEHLYSYVFSLENKNLAYETAIKASVLKHYGISVKLNIEQNVYDGFPIVLVSQQFMLKSESIL